MLMTTFRLKNLQGEDSLSEDSLSVDSGDRRLDEDSLSEDSLSVDSDDRRLDEDSLSEDSLSVDSLSDDDRRLDEDSLSEDSLSVDSLSDDDRRLDEDSVDSLSDDDLSDDDDRRLSGKSFKRNDPADHTDDEIEDQDDLAGSLSTHWTGYCIKPYTWNATTSKCDGTSPVNSVRCFKYFTADTSTCQCVFNSDNTYAYDMICLYQFTLNDTC